MNENDNPPVFTRPSITVQVPENSGDLSSLVCLFATDEDVGNINPMAYSITRGNTDSLFNINSTTGQLSVKNLDYETHKNFKLFVEANDGRNTAEFCTEPLKRTVIY